MNLLAPAATALALFAAAPVLAQSTQADITLSFDTGARTGAVMVALYDSEAAYSGGAPVRAVRIDAAAGPVVASFQDLPAGDYGMKSFHDLNGDGEMNVNPFGMPIEPYAFSNNAVGAMGPASWERARFAASGATAQTISIR